MHTEERAERVGILGLGRMGLPMAEKWAAAGHHVIGYDVAPEALEKARDRGIEIAASPAELARSADLVFVLVGYEREVYAALEGDEGILAANVGAALTVVLTSTLGAEAVRDMGRILQERDIAVVDAPVCRGEQAAVDGDLMWLVGGDETLVKNIEHVLTVCGKDVFRLGDLGAGQVGKAINNMLLWASMCAGFEARDLATANSVDWEVLRSAVGTSTGGSWALANWERMAKIPWPLKDMELVLKTADLSQTQLPMAGLVRELAKGHQWRAGF